MIPLSHFRAIAAAVLGVLIVVDSSPVFGQHVHGGAPTLVSRPLGLGYARMGSGTTWLPDSSPMRAVHGAWRDWALMFHGTGFVQYSDQGSIRGDTQLGVTDWEMLTATHAAGSGVIDLHVMTSIEPFVIGARGYPLVLQTGESYRHEALHDRQHPHDLFMELAANYEHTIGPSVAASIYAAVVGEPAFGPVAFMHRPSADSDPFAPIGHHWQDATHESFGVVTLGVFSRRAKLEGSVFNAREPDEYRYNFDYQGARLDSYAGRITVAPSNWLVGSTWWAYLSDHDRQETGGKMHRYGASLLAQSRGVAGGGWYSSLIWGTNVHHHSGIDHAALHGGESSPPHHRTSSVLLESTLELGTKDILFGRLERVQKSGADLGFTGGDLTQPFDIRSIAAGYSRAVWSSRGAEVALGFRGAMGFLPQTLELAYGTRRPKGLGLFLRVRPTKVVGQGTSEPVAPIH